MSRFTRNNITPGRLRRLLNLYGPYFGAGVKVDSIAPDWTSVQVSMRMRWYNRNAVGTHFGGSLYAMIDPHFMLMAMNQLGKGYVVWDKSAHIDFVKPGRGTVRAEMHMPAEEIERIRAATANGEKLLPEYTVEVVDEAGEVVARAQKVLYVRKKPPAA